VRAIALLITIVILGVVATPARPAFAEAVSPKLCTPETRDETRAVFSAMWAKYEDLPRQHPDIYAH
jgi:hypothetical protein